MNKRILLSLCHIDGNEMEWVKRAFETGWIVPLGPNVDEFERRLGCYLGRDKVVVALSSGTAAIHLGLLMAGVKEGDEVVCQSLTFAASVNPIRYLGAHPVLVDSEPSTWNMDPEALDRAIADRIAVTGRRPAAIVVVHLYGMPAKMHEVMEVAARYGIPVVEDAAEALGSELDGIKCGTFGEYGALSFNGNKIITTSGGGALVCPDERASDRVKFYATQARENRPYYYHLEIGYNYRLSNVSAGIGCGQMEVLQAHVDRRRAIHALYQQLLADNDQVEVHDNPSAEYNSNFWLSTVLLKDNAKLDPEALRQALEAENIESRRIWRPMHMQPVFADAPFYATGVGEEVFNRGLCLPSGSSLTDDDIHRVVNAINRALGL